MTSQSQKWEELLNPEVMQEKLISASLFIAAFEVLKQSVCGRIRDFYCVGFTERGDVVDPAYYVEVAGRKKNLVDASLSWLLEYEVIDAADLESFRRVRRARNELAHNLQGLVAGDVPATHIELFPILIGLLRRVETWWIVNVELPLNPDCAATEIDETGVVPGPVIMLQLMLEVAAGNRRFLAAYKQGQGAAGSP